MTFTHPQAHVLNNHIETRYEKTKNGTKRGKDPKLTRTSVKVADFRSKITWTKSPEKVVDNSKFQNQKNILVFSFERHDGRILFGL